MSLREVKEKMEANQPLTPEERSAAVAALAGWRDRAMEKRLPGAAKRFEASIESIREYAPIKRRTSPRPYGDIQRDIDTCTEFIKGYESSRRYELAAAWKRNRDELEKEYDLAATGKMYSPALSYEREIERHAPQGWQGEMGGTGSGF